MVKHPNLFEINTRVWLRRFDTPEKRVKLEDIPAHYWDKLLEQGIDCVWLMGVWKTCESTIEKYCFENSLVNEYKKALRDWRKEDVIGSPFAIDIYEVNPYLGDLRSLHQIKTELNQRGMKLILDFVPNHFSADSSLINVNPDIFLKTNGNYFNDDPHTFFKPFNDGESYFAHGRDPFFPSWQDTIQVNYFNKSAREFMIKTLINLTKICDGVRCDMAMLALNNVFKNTWGGVLADLGHQKPEEEFWKVALQIVKDACPEFIFIAEAYWGLEYELQQLGFDFTYDKNLTDRLKGWEVRDIRDHLLADKSYQEKSVRFIENHDEDRALSLLGLEKSLAAAVIISTLQGMHLYHDGQTEGRKIKLPVQLGREPEEKRKDCIYNFYDKLFEITKTNIFKQGVWELLRSMPSWDGNETYKNILAWEWKFKDERRLTVVNYTDKTSSCRIKLDVRGYPEELTIVDLLINKTYHRSAEEIIHTGLFVELKAYQSHIFSY